MSGGSAGNNVGDKLVREASNNGLSDDDDREACAALAPKEFVEDGVRHTQCANFLICSGYAKEVRIVCGPCWQGFGRILFLSEKEEDITCYVCAETGKKCVKYTCTDKHGVCMKCFIKNRLNWKGYNMLRSCTLCKLQRQEVNPNRPNDPPKIIKLGQPDGILLREHDDPMLEDLSEDEVKQRKTVWN